MGAGAVVAGITLAGKVAGRVRTLTIAAAALGIAMTAAALAPSPAIEGICLALIGAASVVFSSSTNATLQVRADPSMRGRVVALYIMAFMGSTAIGGPLVGVAGEVLGPRASLGVGAVGCAGGVLLALALGTGQHGLSGRRSPAYAGRSTAGAVPPGAPGAHPHGGR
jgi:predicted MFS family arabinose efflux permease